MTLEEEFAERVFAHKLAIIGAVATKFYIDNYNEGRDIREVENEANATIFGQVIPELLNTNKFETAYDNSWSAIAEFLP